MEDESWWYGPAVLCPVGDMPTQPQRSYLLTSMHQSFASSRLWLGVAAVLVFEPVESGYLHTYHLVHRLQQLVVLVIPTMKMARILMT